MATFEQRVLWRSAWAVFVYTALVSGFGGALHARRAHRAALATCPSGGGAGAAELAAISGKLNPHFLFNTLNSIIFLTRKDAGAAESALLSFARMLRYLLDANRGTADRVPLREELDFVRDYLDLETLRLGTRLAVAWRIDDAALDVGSRRSLCSRWSRTRSCTASRRAPSQAQCRSRPSGQASAADLVLRVRDDGAGLRLAARDQRRGARTASASARCAGASSSTMTAALGSHIRSAPGQGFCVEIVIPADRTGIMKRYTTLIAEDEPLAQRRPRRMGARAARSSS